MDNNLKWKKIVIVLNNSWKHFTVQMLIVN